MMAAKPTRTTKIHDVVADEGARDGGDEASELPDDLGDDGCFAAGRCSGCCDADRSACGKQAFDYLRCPIIPWVESGPAHIIRVCRLRKGRPGDNRNGKGKK
jgi:hypothetical protein